MFEEEANHVFELVKSGFDEFVKPDLTEEGTVEFFEASHSFIHERPDNHFIFVARLENEIIGMIDVRDNSHICLFFVPKEFHHQGIGRRLLDQAISRCCLQIPQIKTMDVNSSTFAVKAYKSLGFVQIQEVQLVNGIKFVPMIKAI